MQHLHWGKKRFTIYLGAVIFENFTQLSDNELGSGRLSCLEKDKLICVNYQEHLIAKMR